MAHPTNAVTERKPPRGVGSRRVNITFETQRESQDRWIAEVPNIPGVLAYGTTKEDAIANAYALALEVIAADAKESKDCPSINVEPLSA
jgi:predicted RNase H-like HicB family nuclease